MTNAAASRAIGRARDSPEHVGGGGTRHELVVQPERVERQILPGEGRDVELRKHGGVSVLKSNERVGKSAGVDAIRKVVATDARDEDCPVVREVVRVEDERGPAVQRFACLGHNLFNDEPVSRRGVNRLD